ncbi:unnamed protein product [Ophioblennius macclurei]
MTDTVLKVKVDRKPKLVTVRSFGEKLQLCCVDRQTRGTLVQMFTREEDNKTQVAFSFTYKKHSYSLMVDGNYLKLEQAAHSDSGRLPDSCWFERTTVGGSSEHYILRSVVTPRPYLSPIKGRRIVLGLSQNNDESVLVTHE